MATKKGGGAKTTRSETVTVRIEPKLRYLAEIAARTQRRTLSGFIEWAVEDSLKNAWLDANTSVANCAETLWDVDEADRFVKLALYAPSLLNYDEQRLWKLIREYGLLWKGYWTLGAEYQWGISEDSVDWTKLRELWPLLVAKAQDESVQLPEWEPPVHPSIAGEIPF